MFTQLKFTHFVISKDGTIFGSARDRKNQVENFLISKEGRIKRQIKRNFEPVNAEEIQPLRKRIDTYYSRVPVYRIREIPLS